MKNSFQPQYETFSLYVRLRRQARVKEFTAAERTRNLLSRPVRPTSKLTKGRRTEGVPVAW